MESFIEQFLKKETVTGMIFDVDGTLLDSMPVWAAVSCDAWHKGAGVIGQGIVFHDDAKGCRVYQAGLCDVTDAGRNQGRDYTSRCQGI